MSAGQILVQKRFASQSMANPWFGLSGDLFLWDFAYDSCMEPTAAPLQRHSKFLESQQKALQGARAYLPKLQEAIKKGGALGSGHPNNPYALQEDANALLQSITEFAKAARAGGSHALDAEMHWLYDMLHDIGIKRSLDHRFTLELRQSHALILRLCVSRAPCDQCSRMIIANHHALESRFGCKVEIVISAVADYEQNCVGLAELSKDISWLTFIPEWLNLSKELQE